MSVRFTRRTVNGQSIPGSRKRDLFVFTCLTGFDSLESLGNNFGQCIGMLDLALQSSKQRPKYAFFEMGPSSSFRVQRGYLVIFIGLCLSFGAARAAKPATFRRILLILWRFKTGEMEGSNAMVAAEQLTSAATGSAIVIIVSLRLSQQRCRCMDELRARFRYSSTADGGNEQVRLTSFELAAGASMSPGGRARPAVMPLAFCGLHCFFLATLPCFTPRGMVFEDEKRNVWVLMKKIRVIQWRPAPSNAKG